ncbi:Protein of unknown function [Gryllus bimaculatus]|nr:Protein of unknown function [Gryllus bimaculatus]
MGAKPLADGRTGADSTCNHDSPPIFETVTWKERETFRRGNLIENSHFKIDVGEVKTRYGGKEEEGIQTSKKMLLPDPESGSLHCCSVGIVLSFAYSLYNILLRGRGNAERRVAWALDGELRKEIYRAAKTWDKKRRSPEILRFVKKLTPNFRVRHQRSVKFVSEYEDNFPKEQISKKDVYSFPDEEVSYQSFEVKPETNASRIIKVAPQEERKMEYLVAANEKLTKESPLVEEELGEKKEQGQPFNGSHLACNNSILCHILHVLLIYQNRIDDEHRWFQQRISNLWSNTSYFNTLLLLYSLFLTVCHHQARIR